MKVRQAIELARGLKQIDQVNYPDLLMLQFLNECEGKLQTEFLHIADVDCQRYTENDMDMDLIVGPPHDKLYYAYLCAMIDFTNGEYAKYNNSIIVANAFMAEWAAWFNRTHERDGRQYLGVFLSAYGIAVKHGYAGTEEEWLESLEGPAGPQGPQGKPGPQGAPGTVSFDELTEDQLAMLRGPAGPHGVPGIDGQDGIGIQFVEQTTTSTEDGGTNVVTVTKTDGTTSTFYVRNGSRGSTGPAGSDGQDGVSPTIGANGNWYVGKTDTGVAATSSGVYVGSGDMPGGYNLQIDPEGEETDFIPYIGSNGNWFVGNTDLNVPATGPIGPVGDTGATGPAGPAGSDGQDGVDGKSAYQYAVEGGYTGTEEAFAAKLAAESPAVDDTLTQSGHAADAAAVGEQLSNLSEEIANLQTSGLTTEQVNALDGMFKVCAFTKADVSAEYTAFKTAFGITDSGGETEVTLTSISATYDGGDVAVGTALSDLTGIVVTATYSDGSAATVTGYTLSGEIVEGDNTIIVTYNGKTATFTVTGTVEHERVEHIVSGQTFPVTLTWSPVAFDVTPSLATFVSGDESIYYDVEIDVESISSENAYIVASAGGGTFLKNASDYAGQTGTLKMTGQVWHPNMSNASQINVSCNKGTETDNQTAVITGVRIYER